MPRDNDSAWLLDPHRRGLQNLDRMRRYGAASRVDLVDRRCRSRRRHARPAARPRRLADRDPREAGRSGIPDRDWVSDEKGSGPIYWTDKRIISGEDPVEMGKNNSGVGVGGSMTHFAGYVPRFHPSDFEVRTRDGVGGRLADLLRRI